MDSGTLEMDLVNNNVKATFLKDLLRDVSSRIGREVDRGERNALGFVIDKRLQPGETVSSFLEEVFKLQPEDDQTQSSVKISQAIDETLKEHIAKLRQEANGDLVLLDQLKAQEMLVDYGSKLVIEASKQGAEEIGLGGVPSLWIPDWVKLAS